MTPLADGVSMLDNYIVVYYVTIAHGQGSHLWSGALWGRAGVTGHGGSGLRGRRAARGGAERGGLDFVRQGGFAVFVAGVRRTTWGFAGPVLQAGLPGLGGLRCAGRGRESGASGFAGAGLARLCESERVFRGLQDGMGLRGAGLAGWASWVCFRRAGRTALSGAGSVRSSSS